MTSDVNRSIEEQLSAFLDDELRDEELDLLVRRLERNEEYRATLARYSLIGNVVRKDPVHTYPNQTRARIMAAIAAENSTAVPTTRHTPVSRWRSAIASATVVAIVLMAMSNPGLRDRFSGDDSVRQETANVTGLSQPVAAVEPPIAETTRATKRASRQARLNPERLSSYMVSHREYTQPLHEPIANSRIVVQQVRFEE